MSAQNKAYLDQLGSLSLDRLQKEPELLRLEAARHENELQSMATTGYGAFISSVECISFVRESATGMDHTLKSVLNELPELVTSCEEFGAKATALAAERKTNRESLNCYTSLVEVLEVPQVMDTCVRNGHYDEAIELLAFTRSMKRMHPNIAVVSQVLAEVDVSAEAMVNQLLALLKTPLQLHMCLRVVAHLRRLKVFDAAELSQRFVACRNEWLEGNLKDLELEQNTVTRLNKKADCIRVSLFEILTQYDAIFGPDEGSAPGAQNEMAQVYEWAGAKLTALLSELEVSLEWVSDSTLLANLLEQFMHCGHSLSRVGLDFRLLLHPIFTQRVLQIMQTNLAVLPAHFGKLLQQPGASSGPAPPQLHSTSSDPYMAPIDLLSCTALAAMANYILTCLNDLRHCAIVSIAQPMAQLICDAMWQAAVLLQKLGDQCRAERQLMAGSLLPYIERCFCAVFALKEGASPPCFTELRSRIIQFDNPAADAAVPPASLKAAEPPPPISNAPPSVPTASQPISNAPPSGNAPLPPRPTPPPLGNAPPPPMSSVAKRPPPISNAPPPGNAPPPPLPTPPPLGNAPPPMRPPPPVQKPPPPPSGF